MPWERVGRRHALTGLPLAFPRASDYPSRACPHRAGVGRPATRKRSHARFLEPTTVHLVALTLDPPGPKGGAPATQGAPSSPVGGAAPPPAGGGIMMFLPFLILIPFFFLMSRRNKKESEARQKLKKGDRVASTAGLVGELIEMDE